MKVQEEYIKIIEKEADPSADPIRCIYKAVQNPMLYNEQQQIM